MIVVNSQPEIGPNRQDGGCELTLWMGEAFDYTTPFRAALNEMAEALSQQVPCSVHLPDYEEYEDFIEGTFRFGDKVLLIYYEHSLGYLTLSSDSEDLLRDIAIRLQPALRVAPLPED